MKDFFDYQDNKITITYPNYGSEGRNLGELFDWLGDIAHFTQANELYQFACLDDCGNIFEFTNSDEVKLSKEGKVVLESTGETINDYKETHKDFYNWFLTLKIKIINYEIF